MNQLIAAIMSALGELGFRIFYHSDQNGSCNIRQGYLVAAGRFARASPASVSTCSIRGPGVGCATINARPESHGSLCHGDRRGFTTMRGAHVTGQAATLKKWDAGRLIRIARGWRFQPATSQAKMFCGGRISRDDWPDLDPI